MPLCRIARCLVFAFLALATFLPAALAQLVEPGDRDRQRARALQVIENFQALLEVESARPDPSDVPSRAAILGFDPRRIYEFVRDEIAFEPYLGRLRGPRGTLISGAGNSVDKCLLLGALLESAGHATRLVEGRIAPERAAEMVRAFLGGDPGRGTLGAFMKPEPVSGEEIARACEASGLDPAAVQADMTRAMAMRAREDAEIWQVADRELGHLRTALRSGGIEIHERTQADTHAFLAERCANHVWLEVREGAKWIALDPSFPGAVWGDAPGAGRPNPRAGEPHVVVFRLLYRREAGGRVEERKILEVPIRADESYERFPSFAILPSDGDLQVPEDPSKLEPADLEKWLFGGRMFQAVLSVGRKIHASFPFDLEGSIYDVSETGQLVTPAEAGGLLGPFGPKAGPPRFLELAVEFAVLAPGEAARIQRRTLLAGEDLRGDHRQSAVVAWELLLQPGPVGGDYLAGRIVERDLAVVETLLAVAGGKSILGVLAARSNREAERCPWTLLDFACRRQRLLARAADGDGTLPLWDGVQVFVLERRGCLCNCENRFRSRVVLDIVENGVKFLGRGPRSQGSSTAMRAGVLDTVLEAYVVSEFGGATSSAVQYFEAARIRGAKSVVRRPEQDLEAMGVRPEDRAWIASFEPRERVLVGMDGQGAGFWWSVDPAWGTVLGRGPGGRGSGTTERALLEKNTVTWKSMLTLHKELLKMFWCLASMIYDAAHGDPRWMAVRYLWKMLYCMYKANYGIGAAMGEWAKMGRLQTAAWAFVDYQISTALGGKGIIGGYSSSALGYLLGLAGM